MKPYNFRKRLMAATPIMCLIIFLLLGTIWDLWHPGWIIFLTIPVFEIFASGVKVKKNHKDNDDDDDEIIIDIK